MDDRRGNPDAVELEGEVQNAAARCDHRLRLMEVDGQVQCEEEGKQRDDERYPLVRFTALRQKRKNCDSGQRREENQRQDEVVYCHWSSRSPYLRCNAALVACSVNAV